MPPLLLQTPTNPGVATFEDILSLITAGANVTIIAVPGGIQISAAGGGGGGASNQFILRPAGPADPTNNVYTTWATVHAAAALVEGEKLILIEPVAVGTPVAVGPAAAYDMSGISLQGPLVTSQQELAILTIADGVTFTSWAGNTPFCRLDFFGTATPLFTVDTGGLGDPYTMKSGFRATWRARGTVEMVQVINSSVLTFYLDGFAQIGNIDAAGFATFGAPTLFTGISFKVGSSAAIYAVSVTGPLGNADVVVDGGETFGFSLSLGQPGLPGGTFASVSGSQFFTSGTPADWAPPPESNGEALNRLAAFVQAMDVALGAAAVAGFPLGPIP